ncbi:MarR family winged helix-turn-helix transcriptional regulator [Paenibacillus gansuensis]|uniref:MarR family winged helix-turn-helix transcriptional regulator n=1 Tax=Paenibacillus gansuensis TaxID=306542 RepID=A0ABW5PBH3_9BACL
MMLKNNINDFIGIMIHRADLTLTSQMKKKLAPYDITAEQNIIMLLLWNKDGVTQKEIAEQLNKDQTNIARMIFSLEKKGFIHRVTPEYDRRSLVVWLTEKGRELENLVAPLSLEFNQKITEGLTEEELLDFKRIIAKIRQNAC